MVKLYICQEDNYIIFYIHGYIHQTYITQQHKMHTKREDGTQSTNLQTHVSVEKYRYYTLIITHKSLTCIYIHMENYGQRQASVHPNIYVGIGHIQLYPICIKNDE